MNKSMYRLVWNHSLGALQVVSELAKSRVCAASGTVRGAFSTLSSRPPRHRVAWPLALLAIGVATSVAAATGTPGSDGGAGVQGTAGSDAVANDATPGSAGGTGGAGSDGGSGLDAAGVALSNTDAGSGGVGGNGATGGSGGQGGNADGSATNQQSAAGGAGGAGGSAGSGGAGLQASISAVDNSAALLGGAGGNGAAGGVGGSGGYIALYSAYTGVAPGVFTTGAGGAGGQGGAGASGGSGLAVDTSLLNNSGAVVGGNGGIGAIGGAGGLGGNAQVEDSSYSGTSTGSSFAGGNGGAGGDGGAGGKGGAGLTATNSAVNNSASVIGGNAGAAGDGGSGANADDSYYSTEINSALPYTISGRTGSGGNGGSGGAGATGGSGVSLDAATLFNSGVIRGGNGSAGGNGGNGADAGYGQFYSFNYAGAASSTVTFSTGNGGNGGNGGSGGDGGNGLDARNARFTNSGTITGGNGGNAGAGGNGGTGGHADFYNADTALGNTASDGNGGNGGNAGNGGNGGAAIVAAASTITNTGSLVGGNGGAAGTAGAGGQASTASTNFNTTTYTPGSDGSAGNSASAGQGGVGVRGTGNATVYNAGVIAGGFADAGNGAQANAVEFTGGGNTLVLEQGSLIQGNAVSLGGGDTLALGGDASSASGEVFDLASAGVQYQGFDTYSKQGQSTWRLQGVDSLGETWNVNAGTLALDQGTALLGAVNVNAGTFVLDQDSRVGTDVTVASGANVLASTASIGGGLLNQGNVSLASGTDSTNTLTTGSFTQTSTGTLTVSALNNVMFDKLVVNGTANLAGTLAVDAKSGTTVPVGSELNTVIKAGTVNGQFATITDNSLLFNFAPTYTANSVSLNVVSAASNPGGATDTPVTTVGSVVASENPAGIGAAQALDQTFATAPTSPLASYFVPLTTTAEVSRAVSETLPAPNASTGAATTALTSINQVIQARSDAVRGLSSGEGFVNDGHVWFKPFGSWAWQNGSGGSADMKASVGGLAVGADGKRNENLTLGAAFVYAKVDSHNTGNAPRQSLDTDVFQLIGYGSYQLDPITALNFQVDAGQNRNNGKRDLSFADTQAKSHYSSWTAHAGTSLDRTYRIAPDTRFIPSVRADYTWIKDDAYRENGADALDLKANKRTTDSLILGVDGKLAHDFNAKVTASVNAGVGYDVLAERNSITTAFAGAPGAAFTTYGNDAQHWVGRGGAGVTYKVSDRVQVGVRYDLELRKDFTNQTASAEWRWAF